MIRIEEIKKTFGTQEVLKGISTTFEQGKTNLMIGKSGAGKTVLLKILVGLVQPTSGTVWYNDTNFTKLNIKQRKTYMHELATTSTELVFSVFVGFENIHTKGGCKCRKG